MTEVPQWPPTHYSADAEQQQGGQHGIVVRNTFIDVRHPEDASDDKTPSSPHRRNLSAPPSPARVARRSRDPNAWGQADDEGNDIGIEDPGANPNFHWGVEQNLFFQDAVGSGTQLYSSWPDQYIEDCAAAHKFWPDAPRFNEAPGPSPPGLLSSPGQRDGKGGKKGRPQAPDGGGYKGAKGQPLGSYLRSPGNDLSLGGFSNLDLMGGHGAEQGFMPGSGMDFSYVNGFGAPDHGGGFGFDAGLGLGGPPFASQQPRGRDGMPLAQGFLEQPGLGQPPMHPGQHPGNEHPGLAVGGRRGRGGGPPGGNEVGRGRGGRGGDPLREMGGQGLGGLGGFGQDIWSTDASARWVNPAVQQNLHGYSGLPPPPMEPPPPRDAQFPGSGSREDDQHHGHGGKGKQRRGHLLQQWPSGEGEGASSAFQFASGLSGSASGHGRKAPVGGPPPGRFIEGQQTSPGSGAGGYGHAPAGAGLGIAAGAAAVGPVVSAGHERGPLLNMGSPPSAGRGRDPLAVGSAAIGSGAGVLPSSFGVGAFPTSGMPTGPPGHPSAGTAPGAAPSRGQIGQSQARMVNAGKGGHGPWVPEGIDLSSAFLTAGPQDNKGRNARRLEAKGGGSSNSIAAASGGVANRMPLSGGGPKRTDYIRKYGGAGEEEGIVAVPITTMMLKNIPCRKSQEEVMEHIDSKGFAHRYDFFYLPRDVKFRANLGYAFINFVTDVDAACFMAEMDGYRFANSGSSKACAVAPAHVQGLMNNLAAFKRTEVMRSSRKPYFSGVAEL